MQTIEALGFAGIVAGIVMHACSRRIRDRRIGNFLSGVGAGMAFAGIVLLYIVMRPG